MSDELERRRDVGALLGDAFQLYRSNFGSFVAIAAAIVLPVQLIVTGLGLEQLTSGHDPSPPPAQTLVPAVVSFLVTTPLVTAICIYALRSVSAGRGVRAGTAITAGLEAFTPIFAAVLLAALGIAVGLVLILPGVYLAVRWFFVPQAVVVDTARGPGAIARSGQLVQGSWWRTFGIVVLANLAATIPALVLQVPLEALARSADREAVSLAGRIVVETLATPFVALVSTLLYFDLRVRGREVAAG